MDLLTIDFETYWDNDFTLSKLTTDEYVLDPRFKVHGAAVHLKSMHGKPVYLPDTFLEIFLTGIDWTNTAVMAHNTAFDGFILTQHYRAKPCFYFDTLSMARALIGVQVGGSLKKVAEFYGLGAKGDAVLNTKGIRDLPAELHRQLADYAINDLVLCQQAFKKMAPEFSKEELKLIDMTVRMFTEPVVYLDKEMLAQEIESERTRKQKIIDDVCRGDPKVLTSNKQFAELLFMYGVEAPTKVSPVTGKETLALAKTDPGFRELLESDDEAVRTLAEARLDLKSTIALTRAERFYTVAAAERQWPVMLNYYGAGTTGRWSGGNKQNPQNMPSGRDGKTPVLRNSVMAPPGHKIVVADSSQIEARTLAWVAGQSDLVEVFRTKGDPYCRMASALYRREITKADKNERQVGKTMVLGCFADDTLVLTSAGPKRIVDVLGTDLLWDGIEWVRHQGVVDQGVQETVLHSGVRATPDHAVLTEHGWKEWAEVHTNPSLWRSALSSANSPCCDGSDRRRKGAEISDSSPLCAAPADGKAASSATTSSKGGQRDATPARNRQRLAGGSTTGRTKTSSRILRTVRACLTASRHVSPAALLAKAAAHTMRIAGFPFIRPGFVTAESSCNTLSSWKGGTTRSSNLIESTTTVGMSPATSGSSPEKKTQLTVARLRSSSDEFSSSRRKCRVFDISYAGPRNRFAIITNDGLALVHNCGYGMGAEKFQAALKNSTGISMTAHEASLAVATYRSSNPQIVKLWDAANAWLYHIAAKQERSLGCFAIGPQGIHLPNGLWIKYPKLRQGADGFSYETRNGRTKIYGVKVVENLIQALARIVVADQMLRVDAYLKRIGGRVWLMAHDEIAAVVPAPHAEAALEEMVRIMHVPPAWANTLPVAAEGGIGDRYGEAK